MKEITLNTILNQYNVPQIFKDWLYEISKNPYVEIHWNILLDCTIYIIGRLSWGNGIKLAVNFSPNNLWVKDINKVLLPKCQYRKFKNNDYKNFIITTNWMLD